MKELGREVLQRDSLRAEARGELIEQPLKARNKRKVGARAQSRIALGELIEHIGEACRLGGARRFVGGGSRAQMLGGLFQGGHVFGIAGRRLEGERLKGRVEK